MSDPYTTPPSNERSAKCPHPFTLFNNTLNHVGPNLSDEEMLQKCIEYVSNKAEQPNCTNQTTNKSGKPCSCSCLSILKDKEELIVPVARYMISFYQKDFHQKYETIINWHKYSINKEYLIPFLNNEEHPMSLENQHLLSDVRVCANAIGTLLDWGKCRWKSVRDHVANNTIPHHGNKGKEKTNTKLSADVYDDLHRYFHYLHQLAQPRATLFVREMSGSGLRNDDEDIKELPTSFSKRGLYARFCNERGYRVSTSPSGVDTLVEDENFDGEKRLPVCRWASFFNFWRKYYPKLRLQRAAKDVCGECFTFRNQLSKGLISATLEENQQSTECVPCELFPSENSHETTEVAETDMTNLADNQPSEEVRLRKEKISRAAYHVAQAAAQRMLANKKINEACEDFQNSVQHSRRRYTFVCDYCQNMQLPYFGKEQPGDTYYFSPLTINVFGVVDCSVEHGILSAHVYDKGKGKKGGDNVASLLMKELKCKNLLRDDECGGELTIIMDNCAGQNKNNMVLRLSAYLVEAKFFKKVSFVFYIVGHTKNCADRWFNILKKNYRKENIYTNQQLLSAMRHSSITVRPVISGDFEEWGSFLDKFYKKLEPGSIQKNHIFEVSHSTTLVLKTDNITTNVSQDTQELRKGGGKNNICRKDQLRQIPRSKIKDPGVAEIKQVELYTKYRKFVPDQFQEDICPYPGKDIMERIKDSRNEKARERAAKKRKTTHSKHTLQDGTSSNKLTTNNNSLPSTSNKHPKSKDITKGKSQTISFTTLKINLPNIDVLGVTIKEKNGKDKFVFIETIDQNSPMKGILIPGDVFVSLNEKVISHTVEYKNEFAASKNKPRVLTIRRMLP